MTKFFTGLDMYTKTDELTDFLLAAAGEDCGSTTANSNSTPGPNHSRMLSYALHGNYIWSVHGSVYGHYGNYRDSIRSLLQGLENLLQLVDLNLAHSKYTYM